MLKDQFATYEVAKELKELGFDEPCLAVFDPNLLLQFNFEDKDESFYLYNKNHSINGFPCCNVFDNSIIVPLWQQVIDWLRIEHNTDVCISPAGDNNCNTIGYYYEIIVNDYKKDNIESETYDSYEKARELLILKAIEIIKTNR